MIIEKVTYTNLFGEEVTEDLHFHLTQADVMKFVMKHQAIQARIDALKNPTADAVAERFTPNQLIVYFDELIAMSYGIKTDDGRFIKDSDATKEFMAGEAYSAFFMSIINDPDKAMKFQTGIMPKMDARAKNTST